MFGKLKKVGAVLIIVLLLPYVITTLFRGQTGEERQDALLDAYCIGVLSKEVSSDYEEEMLKCQAVIVRTTVYCKIGELDIEKETISDLDYSWYKRLQKVWEETEGQVVMYEEELALVPFHQLSCGKTRSLEEVLGDTNYPYLSGKECPADIGSEDLVQTTILEISGAKVISTDSAGYVLEVEMGENTLSGDSFRDTYGLVSGCFELLEFEGKTRVITRGIGHGLGLSQYTANEMAKQGKTYEEILQFFFEGTVIGEVAEILRLSE